MNRLSLVVVAAATLLGAGAASAQSVDFGIGGAGVRVDDGYHGYRGDRDWRRDRDFRRSRGEVIVVQPGRRDWDGGRSRYYEDRY
jgi:opacity protein-like surface antigen